MIRQKKIGNSLKKYHGSDIVDADGIDNEKANAYSDKARTPVYLSKALGGKVINMAI